MGINGQKHQASPLSACIEDLHAEIAREACLRDGVPDATRPSEAFFTRVFFFFFEVTLLYPIHLAKFCCLDVLLLHRVVAHLFMVVKVWWSTGVDIRWIYVM